MKKQDVIHASVFTDPNEIVSHLVGLKDIRVLAYLRRGPVGEIVIEQVLKDPRCPTCGSRSRVKDRPVVSYVDLPFGGVPITIRWKKHRMQCVEGSCPTKTFTLRDHRISAKGCRLTTRAAKWVVKQIGHGRTVAEIARDLSTSWGVINAAMLTYGSALLDADTKRLKDTEAIGLDETLFVKEGRFKKKRWSTTVCDVGNHQLIDILPTRDYVEVADFLTHMPQHRRERIRYGCLDMSRTYQAVYRVATPKALQIIDRFHVIKNANDALDQVRRRVQLQALGHRGRKGDPLYRSRRLLVMNHDRLDKGATDRLTSLLSLGDPDGEVAFAHGIKEAVLSFYEQADPDSALDHLRDVIDAATRRSSPPEVRRFGRTLTNWFTSITNWHTARHSNGPTEGMNNLLKRIKRTAYGFTNFENFRMRALLYAGKPNFRVLDSIVVT